MLKITSMKSLMFILALVGILIGINVVSGNFKGFSVKGVSILVITVGMFVWVFGFTPIGVWFEKLYKKAIEEVQGGRK